MPFTPEYTDVVDGSPELLSNAAKEPHGWVSKVAPHVFTNVERLEGGEGVDGFDMHFEVHEDKHAHHGGASKIKVVMEERDDENMTYRVRYEGDPNYITKKFHTRMLPGPSPNTTTLKWRIEYVPYDEKTGAPDDLVALNIPHTIFKDLAAHLEAEKQKENVEAEKQKEDVEAEKQKEDIEAEKQKEDVEAEKPTEHLEAEKPNRAS